MKKYLLILIAVAMLFAAACSDDGESAGSMTSDGDDMTAEPSSYTSDDLTLDMLDGWWYAAEGYPADGSIVVQKFRIDASSETWSCLDQWGDEAYSDYAYIGDDGTLCLGFELGDAFFTVEDASILYDELNELAYVKGGDSDEQGGSGEGGVLSMIGKWYENADPEEGYYIFAEDTYKEIPRYVDEELIESTQYVLRETEYYRRDGNLISGIEIDRNDPYEIDTFILSDDGTYFFIPGRGQFYMREDVIGTPAGNQVVREFSLIAGSWGYWGDMGYERLDFCEKGLLALNRQTGTGDETRDVGSWSLSGDTLTLSFTDGSSETLTYTDDTNSLTIERYIMTFTPRGE